MFLKLSCLIYASSLIFSNGESARILAIMPQPFYSHQMVFRALWKELSLRGHKVTLLTTDPINDPKLKNLTEIDLHFIYESAKQNLSDVMYVYQSNMFQAFDAYVDMMNKIIDEELSHPDVERLIKNKNEKFDLMLVEYLHPTMYAFSERFKCPFIGISPLDTTIAGHDAIGNPTHPVLNPEFLLPFEGNLNFIERFISTAYSLWIRYYVHYKVYPREDATIRKHFGDNMPPLQEIEKKVSMVFLNTNPAYYNVRPMLPAVIQIGGGTHIHSENLLPKDIQEFLDEANGGAIYFSLGTNVKSKDLSNHTKNVLIETFAELPYRVLWKFESDNLPHQPTNVKIKKWMPQQDLLRHPNIKLFITQGGLQSIEEAIYNTVPLIGIPFFGDQQANVKRAVSKGIGLFVDYATLDKLTFKKKIFEVIRNKRYKTKIQELAVLSKDQQINGLQKAVWWTEYVLRHKGAKHLKQHISNLPFYQYYLLDVLGALCILCIIFVYLLVKIFTLLYTHLFDKKIKQL